MSDVQINVRINTQQAEAQIRALEARAVRLNAAAGVALGAGSSGIPIERALNYGAVLESLTDLSDRPGSSVVPGPSTPSVNKQTGNSNAMTAAAAAAGAGIAVGGGLRGATEEVLNKPTWYGSRRHAFSFGFDDDVSKMNRRQLVFYENWLRKEGGPQALENRNANKLGKRDMIRKFRGGLTLREELAFASGLRANRNTVQDRISEVAEMRRAGRRRRLARTKVVGILGEFFSRELNVLPGALDKGLDRLGSLGETVKGRLPIPLLGGVGLAVAVSGAGKAMGEAYRRVGVIKALREARYKDIEGQSSLEVGNTAAGIAGERSAGAFNSFVQWFAGGVFDIGTISALVQGEYDLAKMRLETADLLSGRFKDRHDRLSTMQDAWARGFDAAIVAGGRAARGISTASAMRAVEIGLRSGDMLDMDHQIYFEIVKAVKSRYAREYVDKVPYPKMSDIDGENE